MNLFYFSTMDISLLFGFGSVDDFMLELLELLLHVDGVLFMQFFVLVILELEEHQPHHLPMTLSIRKMARSLKRA